MTWPLIPTGSIVDIIAPSGPIEAEHIPLIDNYIRSLGLVPRIPENLIGPHPFSANSDEIRFEHLAKALHAEDSTLIWCVRGGHGTTRIMPELIQLAKPAKQKLLIGFSDITTLHLWLNQKWHWPSLHGPMARQNAVYKNNPLDVAAEEKMLFEGVAGYQFGPLKPLNTAAQQDNMLEGVVTGGCLSLLQASMGTPWQIQADDKILVVEDLNETPYRMDRLLTHLINGGVFNKAKAVIFGDLGENPEAISEMRQFLMGFINEVFAKRFPQLPIYNIEGFGHGSRNKPLPLGVAAQIKSVQNELQLQF